MKAVSARPSALPEELVAPLIERLTAMADDELILGHRLSEWTGHAPLLEEDIALANIAQDELGHALLWFEARAELDGSDPDALAYFRDAGAYRNVRLVELPKGDWALTMVRQYLFDVYESAFFGSLSASSYAPLAEAAAKAAKEELFHLRHTGLWLRRLGHGTEESHRRAQDALDTLWPYFPQLFEALPGDEPLRAAGVIPDLAEVADRVTETVVAKLHEAGLRPPEAPANPGDRSHHTEALVTLLIDMQSVARSDPGASAW